MSKKSKKFIFPNYQTFLGAALFITSALSQANDLYLCDIACESSNSMVLEVTQAHSVGHVFTIFDMERVVTETYEISEMSGGGASK